MSWETACGLKKPMTQADAEYKALAQGKRAYRCKYCKSWHTKKILHTLELDITLLRIGDDRKYKREDE